MFSPTSGRTAAGPFAILLAFLLARAAAAQGAGAQAAVPVTVAEVTRAPAVVTLPLTGTVLARRVSQVSSQVQGFVSELLVDVGDTVETGDVLLRLDEELERTAVRAAAAAVDQARVRLEDARRRRDEALELVQEKNIAATQYESLIAEVLQEEAALARLEAELARRRALLARHVITAPFAGVVAERLTEAGQWVMAGTPLVDLRELDVVRVRAEVPQKWYAEVNVGTPAELRFDAYPQQPMPATVSIRVAVADAAARTFPVLLELDNTGHELAPGMSVRVGLQVAGERAGESLQLPRDAVVRGPDGVNRVWVLRPGRGDTLRVEPVAVLLGRNFGPRVEIVDGEVRGGDRVVVRGNETLRADQPVRIVSDPAGSS